MFYGNRLLKALIILFILFVSEVLIIGNKWMFLDKIKQPIFL